MADLTKIRAILTRIEGGESENHACKEEGMNRSTFRQTVLREELGSDYARALIGLAEDQANKLEDTIQEMRDGKVDWQVARVEIDARKWFASKFLPKRYGDKIDHTTNGKDIPLFMPSEVMDKYHEKKDAERTDTP